MIERNIPFLILDSNEANVEKLTALIRKLYPNSKVNSAYDGLEAWAIIEKLKDAAIIIADTYLPGVNGIQLLKKVKTDKPEPPTYFIIQTTPKDKELNLKALQSGADELLYKPWTVEDLIGRVRAATHVLRLQITLRIEQAKVVELNEELEKVFQNTFELLLKIQTAKLPEYDKIIKMISRASLWIAKELGIEDEEQLKSIEYASRICFIGKLFLPERHSYEPIMKKGIIVNPAMEMYPVFSRELLSKIRGFEEVANIIVHIYENFDGSGLPDNLQSWKIPYGSRILRVLIDYQDLFKNLNGSFAKAYEAIEAENKRLYDQKVVVLLEQYFAETGEGKLKSNERSVETKDLQEGMIISRKIVTESGLKIVSQTTELDFDTIDKIKLIAKVDPIIGNIYIYG
jgi:response regulator RpfG family c-di-GMP phosphodiesterase